MAQERLRPTFQIPSASNADAVARRLRAALDAHADRWEARWTSNGCRARVAPARDRRRFYSAWLDLHVRRGAEGADATTVLGRFAPSPRLWAAYVLGYIAVLGIGTVALGLTVVLILLEREAWAWWWVQVGAIAIASALFFGTLWAQRKAAREMDDLRAIVEGAVARARETAAHPEAHEPARRAG